MTETNRTIIDAVIQKAEKVCPGSLALIGIYGSAATGDTHAGSDLDLLILINDDLGWQLAEGFILDDTSIGYDLYCTSWQMLQSDAECNHAHLAKLLDSTLVYIADEAAVPKLDALRKQAMDLLVSEDRHTKAQQALDNAKKMFADCFLTDSLSQIRTSAGAVIHFLLDAVMLSCGKYFRMGVKRTFDEIAALALPFDAETLILNVIRAETAVELRERLAFLLKTIQPFLEPPCVKAMPTPENLSGTYEEMVSNWRGKMMESARRNDLFSSFMNTCSLQFMLRDIAEQTAITDIDAMQGFDHCCLTANVQNVDRVLERYLLEYEKAGFEPKRFKNITAFLQHYLA